MSKRRWRLPAVVGVVAVLALSACTSNSGSNGPADLSGANAGAGTTGASAAPTATKAPAAQLAITPALGAQDVNPVAPVTVAVTAGTLASVAVAGPDGTAIEGAIAADQASWVPAAPLGYNKTYTVTAVATNADGATAQKVSTFTTLKPSNLTMPYFNTTGGGSITNGATYGVGMVVDVHFDEEITDRVAAEKSLVVTTVPAVTGSWYWLNGQNVHWRPEAFYAPGTQVTVAANVYGVNVGNGLYGQANRSVSFTIGASHVSIADDNTKQVTVYENGQVVRTMPTSMGKGGSVTVNGKTISFWTQAGTMTVLDKGNPVLMDSETYGLPHNDGGYKEYINFATRITNDGVYLHALQSTVWAQGNTDTSHGCLNLSPANAEWFYNWSVVGDVVQVKNTGGSPLQVWQNGDWGLPWADWVAGSAIH